MTKPAPGATSSRREFLQAAGIGAAATIAAPSIVKAQGAITMRWQSTWPAKDIFHEFAVDYATKVNDMTGGELKIEVLPAGAVVPAFRPPRRRLGGNARRGPWRARLPLRQAAGVGALGLWPGFRDGRQHAAGMAQIRWR